MIGEFFILSTACSTWTCKLTIQRVSSGSSHQTVSSSWYKEVVEYSNRYYPVECFQCQIHDLPQQCLQAPEGRTNLWPDQIVSCLSKILPPHKDDRKKMTPFGVTHVRCLNVLCSYDLILMRPCCSQHIRVWRLFHLKLCSIMDSSCRIFFSQARRHVLVVKVNGDLLKSRIKAKNLLVCGIKSMGELHGWLLDTNTISKVWFWKSMAKLHLVLSVNSCSSSRHNFCPEHWHVSPCVLSWLSASVIQTIFPHICFTLSEVSTDTPV